MASVTVLGRRLPANWGSPAPPPPATCAPSSSTRTRPCRPPPPRRSGPPDHGQATGDSPPLGALLVGAPAAEPAGLRTRPGRREFSHPQDDDRRSMNAG